VVDKSSRGIFLSYRREDSPLADLLESRLRERIPDAHVFTHPDAGPDQNVAELMQDTVASCAVLVALIGRRWVTVADEQGHRRLDNPADLVRLEIQTALQRDVRVIPVLVDGAEPPGQQELPSELHKLARLQMLELRHDRFEYETDQLIDVIQGGPDVDRVADVPVVGPAGPGTLPQGTGRPGGTSAPEAPTRQQTGETAVGGGAVFISYRRKLSEQLAWLVRKELTDHDVDTFVDVENLDSGEFEQTILSQIEAREHFIVLLEPGSLDHIGEDGDWLRREIAHALAHGRNVVPVTASGFEFRRDLVLPPDVAGLPSFTAVAIPSGYLEAAMERLRTRFLKTPSAPTARPAHREGFGDAVDVEVHSEVDLDVLIDGERVLTVDHSQGFDYAMGSVVVYPDSQIVFRGAGFEVARLARLLVDAHTQKAKASVGSDSTQRNILLTKDQVKRAMGKPSDVPDIVRTLSASRDHHERAWAAKRLGYIGDAAAVPPLAKLLNEVHSNQNDHDAWVQANAAEALGRIGDPSALPALKRAFDDYPNKKSYGYMFEAAIRRLQSRTPTAD